jgi:uncharacterized membrane protein
VAVVLAVAASLMLALTFWTMILLGLLLVAGVYLTWQHIVELRA